MYEIHKNLLTVDDYMELYTSAGEKPMLREQVSAALANSNFTLCIKDKGRPVGMGRIIGDGALSFFINDVAVLPDYLRKSIGTLIMDLLLEHIKETTPKGYHIYVQLISSENKEAFYEKFRFGKKPGDGMGHRMMALVIGNK